MMNRGLRPGLQFGGSSGAAIKLGFLNSLNPKDAFLPRQLWKKLAQSIYHMLLSLVEILAIHKPLEICYQEDH